MQHLKLFQPVHHLTSLDFSRSNAAVTCTCTAHLAVQLLCQAAGLPLHGRHLISHSVISRGGFRWRAIALLGCSHCCCQLSLLHFNSLPQRVVVLLSRRSMHHQQHIVMQRRTLGVFVATCCATQHSTQVLQQTLGKFCLQYVRLRFSHYASMRASNVLIAIPTSSLL